MRHSDSVAEIGFSTPALSGFIMLYVGIYHMDSDDSRDRKTEALHGLARKEHDRRNSTTRRQLLRASAIAGAGALSLSAATGSAAADPAGTLPVSSDDPLLKIRADRMVLVPRTSNVSNPSDGTLTYRSDK